MAIIYSVKIVEQNVNPTTGYHTIVLQSIEVDDTTENRTEGYMKTFGIDADALQSMYGGDILAFAASKKPEMTATHKTVQLSLKQSSSVIGTEL